MLVGPAEANKSVQGDLQMPDSKRGTKASERIYKNLRQSIILGQAAHAPSCNDYIICAP